MFAHTDLELLCLQYGIRTFIYKRQLIFNRSLPFEFSVITDKSIFVPQYQATAMCHLQLTYSALRVIDFAESVHSTIHVHLPENVNHIQVAPSTCICDALQENGSSDICGQCSFRLACTSMNTDLRATLSAD